MNVLNDSEPSAPTGRPSSRSIPGTIGWICALTILSCANLFVSGCAERLEVVDAPEDRAPSTSSGGREQTDPSPDEQPTGHDQPDEERPTFPAFSGSFQHMRRADGVVTTTVDASDSAAWQHLDLDTGLAATEGWDLGFSRFRVVSNGGVSGDGGVLTTALPGQSFEELRRAPATGWMSDESADENEAPEFTSAIFNAFHRTEGEWYSYELGSHTLTPEDITFAVVSTEARFYKLRFETYYDDAGSPAILTLRWAEIEPPDDPLELLDQQREDFE